MYSTKEDTPSIINSTVPRRCYNFIRTDSRDIETMLANLTTVQKWSEWLRWDESGGKVSCIFCALCTKHVDRLKARLVPRP